MIQRSANHIKTRELHREQWPEFCRKLAAECRGSIITANEMTSEGLQKPLVEKAPLEEVEFSERKGQCSDVMRFKAGGMDHEITEPITVKLRDGNGGGNNRYNQVEILAESGATVIHINPGLPPDF